MYENGVKWVSSLIMQREKNLIYHINKFSTETSPAGKANRISVFVIKGNRHFFSLETRIAIKSITINYKMKIFLSAEFSDTHNTFK